VRYTLLPGLEFALGADATSVLFVTLSTALWFLTTVYAVGYLEDSPHRSRFFGFFSLCVTATVGLALASNLVTFLIFYELLTLSTYPLLVHRGTPESMRGGKVYLCYTMAGGALLLLAVAWLQSLAGPVTFTERGVLEGLAETHRGELQVLFFLFIAALGGEERAGAVARLAAAGDGRAGSGQLAVARGGGGQGRCLRHRAAGLRRVRSRDGEIPRRAGAARLAGGVHHPLRIGARVVPAEAQIPARLFHHQPGFLHRFLARPSSGRWRPSAGWCIWCIKA
jgi:hypothetical protein